MKIAITGHTKGIGKACADLLGQEHEIAGLSRSNGFDVQQTNMCAMKVVPCDVFINNAYLSTYQSALFEKVFLTWYQMDKTIINIGSRSQYSHNVSGTMYSSDKAHLSRLAEHLTFGHKVDMETKKCRVININPGWVNTDMANLNLNPTSYKPPVDKMLTPEKVAETIKWCLDQPQDIEIYDLSIWKTSVK